MFYYKFKILFWAIVLCSIRSVSANFQKMLIFKVLMIYRKWKLCHLWPKLLIFGNWASKNVPDWQPCVVFEIRKIVLNHSTLLCTLVYKLIQLGYHGNLVLWPRKCMQSYILNSQLEGYSDALLRLCHVI